MDTVVLDTLILVPSIQKCSYIAVRGRSRPCDLPAVSGILVVDCDDGVTARLQDHYCVTFLQSALPGDQILDKDTRPLAS